MCSIPVCFKFVMVVQLIILQFKWGTGHFSFFGRQLLVLFSHSGYDILDFRHWVIFTSFLPRVEKHLTCEGLNYFLDMFWWQACSTKRRPVRDRCVFWFQEQVQRMSHLLVGSITFWMKSLSHQRPERDHRTDKFWGEKLRTVWALELGWWNGL